MRVKRHITAAWIFEYQTSDGQTGPDPQLTNFSTAAKVLYRYSTLLLRVFRLLYVAAERGVGQDMGFQHPVLAGSGSQTIRSISMKFVRPLKCSPAGAPAATRFIAFALIFPFPFSWYREPIKLKYRKRRVIRVTTFEIVEIVLCR